MRGATQLLPSPQGGSRIRALDTTRDQQIDVIGHQTVRHWLHLEPGGGTQQCHHHGAGRIYWLERGISVTRVDPREESRQVEIVKTAER